MLDNLKLWSLTFEWPILDYLNLNLLSQDNNRLYTAKLEFTTKELINS